MKAHLTGRPRGLTLQVVLVDHSQAYADALGRLLKGHAYGVKLAASYPDLAAWQSQPPAPVDALLLADDLTGLTPELVTTAFAGGARRVVVLVTDPGAPALTKLRQAGAAMVFKYSPGLTLVEAVTAIPPRVAGKSSPLGAQAVALAPISSLQSARTLVVYSPAGGSGKTLLATNLAAGFAARRLRTALVDLAQFGATTPGYRVNGQGKGLSNVASILTQQPELVRSPRFGEYLQQALLPVAVAGGTVDLLPAPAPSRSDQVKPVHVAAVLRTLQALQYERIVVDTGAELGDRTAAALTQAQLIVVPVPPDFSAAYHCLQLRDMLQALDIPRNRVGLVLNRWRTDVAFSLEEFRELVRLPLLGVLPDAPRQAQRLANQGKSLQGRWGLAGALRRLVEAVEQGELAGS